MPSGSRYEEDAPLVRAGARFRDGVGSQHIDHDYTSGLCG